MGTAQLPTFWEPGRATGAGEPTVWTQAFTLSVFRTHPPGQAFRKQTYLLAEGRGRDLWTSEGPGAFKPQLLCPISAESEIFKSNNWKQKRPSKEAFKYSNEVFMEGKESQQRELDRITEAAQCGCKNPSKVAWSYLLIYLRPLSTPFYCLGFKTCGLVLVFCSVL